MGSNDGGVLSVVPKKKKHLNLRVVEYRIKWKTYTGKMQTNEIPRLRSDPEAYRMNKRRKNQ